VTAEGHPPATSAEPDERTRVSTLELFFDLVFVFTITQLTQLFADRLAVRNRVLRGQCRP